MVMGKGAGAAALRLGKTLVVFVCLLQPVAPQCKILNCNTEFWASAPSSGPSEEFCAALRAYSHCVWRTARSCRGDLAYHSAQHGIEDLMSQHNCSSEGPVAHTVPAMPSVPPLVPTDSGIPSDGPELCQYERSVGRPKYTHCGFFGDPHLRTFNDQFQTCRVLGAWPLIHNKYLSVQVTNTPVLAGSIATATSKLTIIFKSLPSCTDQKTYHAEAGELVAAFTDGSQSAGALHILEKVPGRHVEIQGRHIGATLLIRQVGGFLTFAARMPEEVTHSLDDNDDQDLYLCLHGCPGNQIIDSRSPESPARGFTHQLAIAKCKERLPVEDVYFQSCVFDLLSSGDAEFALAAYYALEDVKALHSDKDKYHLFERDAGAFNSASQGCSFALLILLAMSLWTHLCCCKCV
ncbi:hypothetical protein PHYPO_G00215170 [Pangasianodon hypophthalmus]|uniref:Repulsive guidance molecule N-terminal domain-containing protein n=1 Tax=Pangasianodon hypophthalmus TaxID=310915 RepID=A0A5N5P7W5_PANHP|nr:repulsive guidance molecule A isoform X1 [Pangasianodon hypophthalmus]KAB5574966.1 hypothetical protein PHYPO_G00215170 [Pangasianodon hypophthalmus]